MPKSFERNACVLKAVEYFVYALRRNTLLFAYQSTVSRCHKDVGSENLGPFISDIPL